MRKEENSGTIAMLIALEVQDLAIWYDWYRHQAPEKHTDLDLEIAGMKKEEEQQLYDHQQEAWEAIFSANKTTPRTNEYDKSSKSEQEYKPKRKKPTRQQYDKD